jgi:hypothetical protein
MERREPCPKKTEGPMINLDTPDFDAMTFADKHGHPLRGMVVMRTFFGFERIIGYCDVCGTAKKAKTVSCSHEALKP